MEVKAHLQFKPLDLTTLERELNNRKPLFYRKRPQETPDNSNNARPGEEREDTKRSVTFCFCNLGEFWRSGGGSKDIIKDGCGQRDVTHWV